MSSLVASCCIVLDQPVAWRGRRTVTLDGGGAVPDLVDQLERGLEEVHVQTQRPVQVRHGLTGNLPRIAVMADEPPYH